MDHQQQCCTADAWGPRRAELGAVAGGRGDGAGGGCEVTLSRFSWSCSAAFKRSSVSSSLRSSWSLLSIASPLTARLAGRSVMMSPRVPEAELQVGWLHLGWGPSCRLWREDPEVLNRKT